MKVLTALFIALVFSVAVYSQARLNVGMAAPQFSATDMNGDNVALSDLRGKVVVMTFWTTHCPICHVEFPKLNEVAKSFSGKNVVFLSLTTDNEEKVETYMKRTPLVSRVLPNSFGVVLQYADRDRNGNLDMGYPAFFVINPEGTIKYKSSGYDKTASLTSSVNQLLSGN
jgi:peroxiredoxin